MGFLAITGHHYTGKCFVGILRLESRSLAVLDDIVVSQLPDNEQAFFFSYFIFSALPGP